MSPSIKDSTVFSHLTIYNYYLREFCNVQLLKEQNKKQPFDIMAPLNVCMLSMYLDAALGVEWTRKTAYAQCFNEYVTLETIKSLRLIMKRACF